MEPKYRLNKIKLCLLLASSVLASCGNGGGEDVLRSSYLTVASEEGNLGLSTINGKKVIDGGCSSIYWNDSDVVTYSKSSSAYLMKDGKESKIEGYKEVVPYNGSFSLGRDGNGDLYVLDSEYKKTGSQKYASCPFYSKNSALLVDGAGACSVIDGADVHLLSETLSPVSALASKQGIAYYVFKDSHDKYAIASREGEVASSRFDSLETLSFGESTYVIGFSSGGPTAFPSDGSNSFSLAKKSLSLGNAFSTGALFYDETKAYVYDATLKSSFAYSYGASFSPENAVVSDGLLYFANATDKSLVKVDSAGKETELLKGKLSKPALLANSDIVFDMASHEAYHFDGTSIKGDFSGLSFVSFSGHDFFFSGKKVYSSSLSSSVDVGFAISNSVAYGDGSALLRSSDGLNVAFYDFKNESISGKVSLSDPLCDSPSISRDLAFLPLTVGNSNRGDVYYKNGTKVASDVILGITKNNDYTYNGIFMIRNF